MIGDLLVMVGFLVFKLVWWVGKRVGLIDCGEKDLGFWYFWGEGR